MEFTAKAIAELLNGTVDGDENAAVNNVSKIEEGKPGTLSFLANPKYTKYIYTTKSSIVLVNRDFIPDKSIFTTLIRVDDAYQAFAALLELYDQNIKENKTGIESPAYIHDSVLQPDGLYVGAFAYIGENVKLGKNVKIYPQAYISSDVSIGDNTIIGAGVKIYNNCVVGANCIFHSGVVIGSDGFGFVPRHNEDHKKIPQVGNVLIEDNVEIGSNSTIDRATMGSTIIRKGVKIDNLVMIAHNVEIGENTIIAGQSGISGSTKIGRECMLGGQVGVVGHITIADHIKIGAQSGVSNSLKKEGEVVFGSPAYTLNSYQKSYVVFRRLPELNKAIGRLEKEINDLKAQLSDKQ